MKIHCFLSRVCIGIITIFLTIDAQADNYAVGGTIVGLVNDGLVIENNGKEQLIIDAHATSFQFTVPVGDSEDYNVTIFKQPFGLKCTIDNGYGANIKYHVNNIILSCSKYAYMANSNGQSNDSSNISISGVGTNGSTNSSNLNTFDSFYGPQDIVLNAPANSAYILSADFLTGDYYISACQVSAQGTLLGCTGNSNTNTDLSTYGSGLLLTQQYMYITNSLNGANSITVCPVAQSGALPASDSSCTTTATSGPGLHQPAGRIGISSDGQCALIANYANSTISLCPVNSTDGTLGTGSACATASVLTVGGFISNPAGVEIIPGASTTNFVYIANSSNTHLTASNIPADMCATTVAVCTYTLGQCNASGLSCTVTPSPGFDSSGNATFSFGNDIPVNLFASNYGYIYVPNKGTNTLSICQLNPTTGAIVTNSCSTFDPGNGFNGITSAWISFAKTELSITP